MTNPTRRQLGEFLRSRRNSLSPETVGLIPGQRRRTSGLRREEVAELAGISVDWYIRLEQGRAANASIETVDAIARALRLTDAEHSHLRRLSGRSDGQPFSVEEVPAGVSRIVHDLTQPAYVTGRRWDLLEWNEPANELFAFGQLAPDERNTLISMLTGTGARKLFGDGWAAEAQRMVAQFRATHDLWSTDPLFTELTERLRSGCPEFDSWWDAHEIQEIAPGTKWLEHPRRGRIGFEYTTFHPSEDPSLKVVVYTEITDPAPGG